MLPRLLSAIRRLRLVFLALLLAPVAAEAAAAHETRWVPSSDGTMLAVQEWGVRGRPTIVLIHGYLQSHLSWSRQVGVLSRDHHVVTFDLRGHGASDKVEDASRYREDWRWADDIHAVLRATAADRPVLVGWSMGGRVILDYVHKYGQARVAGIMFVGAGLSRAPGMTSDTSAALVGGLATQSLAGSIAATTAFLRACFAVQPEPGAFGAMLAYNMVVPPTVRTLLAGRPANYDSVLRSLDRPVLVVQGEHDALTPLAAAQYAAQTAPNATLLVYPGVGHSPFYEASSRFNADLARFAERARKATP